MSSIVPQNPGVPVPTIVGSTREIVPARPVDADGDWYVNDHCLIQADDGAWHALGINNARPADRSRLYRDHPHLMHASAPSIDGPWTRHDWAIDDSQGERYVGAPFVVRHDGRYVMLFEARWGRRRGLELAFSDDLFDWQRTGREVITNQPAMRRDPCLVRDEQRGDWLLYLCVPIDGRSTLTVCRTADFEAYSEPTVVLSLDDGCEWGSLESPFVIPGHGGWYLAFTHSMRRYCETVVLFSDRHDRFDWSSQITTLHAHAAEFVNDDDRWFVTDCGPDNPRPNNHHGLNLAELRWLSPDPVA